MDYKVETLYVLQNSSVVGNDAETDFLKPKGTKRGDAPRCPVCNTPVGMKVWEPPFRVKIQFWGTRHGDIAYFMDDLLVSERLVDMIRSESLTGIDIISEATVSEVSPKRMAHEIPRYFIGRIRRTEAIFDHVASGAEYRRMWTCTECRIGEMNRHKRVSLIPNTWTGEDLFIAKGLPGVFLTSSRFHDFARSHGFLNVHLIRASEYGVDWFPEKK
jgi:hypothetical protein